MPAGSEENGDDVRVIRIPLAGHKYITKEAKKKLELWSEQGRFPSQDGYQKDLAEEQHIFRSLFKEAFQGRMNRAVTESDLTWDPSPTDDDPELQLARPIEPADHPMGQQNMDVGKYGTMQLLIAVLQQREMIKEQLTDSSLAEAEVDRLTASLAEVEQTIENHHYELLDIGQSAKGCVQASAPAASSGSMDPNLSAAAASTPRAKTSTKQESPTNSPDHKKQKVAKNNKGDEEEFDYDSLGLNEGMD